MMNAADQTMRCFVRDDDIDELTPELIAFVELFTHNGIPVSYQIIPETFTAECAAFMLKAKATYPNLIEFGQHGLRHSMMLHGKRLKREFGPERSLADQTTDIAAGKQLLRARLGHDVTVFTPPQHKFNRSTVQAAAAAGHTLFSAASYATPHHQAAYGLGRMLSLSSIRHHGISHHGRVRPEAPLREISISVAVDNGREITCPAAQLDDAIANAAKYTPIVGLMFHHKVYVGAESELSAIVSRLKAMPHDQFAVLGGLGAHI